MTSFRRFVQLGAIFALAVLTFSLATIPAQAQTITKFDAPGAKGTVGFDINTAGTIAGYYGDSVGAGHGFVRTSTGVFTEFTAPGSGTLPGHERSP